ncbi:MAG: hypothetical protein ACP5MD_14625 [Verrucomicrobiia bacterium]
MANAYEGNLQRLSAIAKEHGLVLNPDAERCCRGGTKTGTVNLVL